MSLHNLRVYRFINRLRILRDSYLLKFMLVLFVGAYLPFIALVTYLLLFQPHGWAGALRVFIAVVLVIAVGTLITVLFLGGLLKPVRQTSDSLKKYLSDRSLPSLPTVYVDEAGQLMADAQYVISRLDNTLRELENISLTDHLTGMYNRRAGEHRLSEEIARAERENKRFLLAFIDLNFLKQINDQHGHDAGDACLIHFASLLADCVRKGDWCARWGGDEFVLAVYQPDIESDLVFNRVLTELESKPCQVRQNLTLPLSVSIGVAIYQRGMSVETLVQQADRAMYQAKMRGGGNSKVVFFGK